MPDGTPAILNFAQAERHAAHVIITAYGESGCGKTYSLIKLGRGLVGPKGKLGMIDTETGRGRIYAGIGGGYLYAELTPPYTPERYIEAIDAAEKAGIDALIIDSGSHEWEGIGGVLELADQQTNSEGKALQGLIKWAKPKARHKKYVQRLLNSRMHLLISLRAKEKLVQLDKPPFPPGARRGDIVSAGFVPIQDKRFIFETTVQLFLPVYHERAKLGVPIIEKCPEDLLGAFPEGAHISEDTGRRIAEWVSGGTPIDREFEALKRAAEEVATEGTEALRAHWRGLSKSARDRLAGEVANLGSIAAAADQEQEERRREREQSHNTFQQISDETPFDHSPPASPGGGDRPGEDSASMDAPTSPPRQGEDHSPVGQPERNDDLGGSAPQPAGETERPLSHAAAPVASNLTQTAPAGRDAHASTDLLGDPPVPDLAVPLPKLRAPLGDWQFYSRQLHGVIAEGHDPAAIERANANGLEGLKRMAPDEHRAVMAALWRV